MQKARRWCAAQERCSLELTQKLRQWGMPANHISAAIQQLIKEGFTDDARFARLFATGKFHTLHWGRVKIAAELKQRKISPETIRMALGEIDEEEYQQTLTKLLKRKMDSLHGESPREAKLKMLKYVISKGFEPDLAFSVAGEID